MTELDRGGHVTVTRIPPNVFGIPFGLVGLAGAWLGIGEGGDVTRGVGDVLLVVAALAWISVLAWYAFGLHGSWPALRGDLVHEITAPFLSLALITPTVFAARGVHPHASGLGAVLVDVLVALTVVHGSWLTGQLIYGRYSFDALHPGYFLPTVAGGLVSATSAAQIGQHGLAVVLFGYGVVSWLILGSMILGRVIFGPPLPTALWPTLAIEVAPAPVASLAWFAINGGRIDLLIQVLAGYGVLMVLVQLRLLPSFLRLHFAASFWSFTFAWAAVATATLTWIDRTDPAGAAVWAWLALAAVTVLVGAIALRTALALLQRSLFPASVPPAGPNVAPSTDRAVPAVR